MSPSIEALDAPPVIQSVYSPVRQTIVPPSQSNVIMLIPSPIYLSSRKNRPRCGIIATIIVSVFMMILKRIN